MAKLALVLPYYGTLPNYFNFYLKSLEPMNFDVLFFSDLVIADCPLNFKATRLSIEELASLAAQKLGTEACLRNGRRLCDFKPMYGHIFEDYLKEYDYWAFGDCDLVYGRALNRYLD